MTLKIEEIGKCLETLIRVIPNSSKAKLKTEAGALKVYVFSPPDRKSVV